MANNNSHPVENLQWKIFTPDDREIIIDFSAYKNIPYSYHCDLVKSFKGVGGAWKYSTRERNRPFFVDLLDFLEEFDWDQTQGLLERFADWVFEKKAHHRAKKALSIAIKVVEHLSDDQQSIWGKIAIPRVEKEASPQVKAGRTLKADHVREIVNVCRRKVDAMVERFELASRLVSENGTCFSPAEELLQKNLLVLLKAGNGYLPTREQAVKDARNLVRMQEFGIRELKSYLFPSLKELIPFYLLILHETAGNPMSVIWAEVDCLIQNPIDPNQWSFNCDKDRGSVVQRKWFSNTKPYEPPRLVENILRITSRSRAHAKGFSKFLFVIVGNSRENVKVPDYGSIHYVLRAFIEENGLQDFDPRDFRRFAANTILEKFKDPSLAQATLQHKSKRTTRRYFDRNKIAKEVAEVISNGQAKILSKIEYKKFTVSKNSDEPAVKPMRTVFGFECADPFAGVAPGSRKGVECDQFGGCGSCDNSVVLIDSPDHVARLLQSRDTLARAEKEALVETEKMLRFKKLYQRTQQIIESVLLPQVPAPVMARAIAIVPKLPPILDIEL